MTKKKEKEKETKEKEEEEKKIPLNEDERKEVAANLDRLLGRSGERSFLGRTSRIFFGTIYGLTLAVAGCVFGVIAAVFLPFFLPISYLRNVWRGNDPLAKVMKDGQID